MRAKLRWTLISRLFVLLAVASFAFAAWTLVSAEGDRSWPSVWGVVREARFTGLLAPNPPSKGNAGGGSPLLRWSVAYEYVVEGEAFRGRDTTSRPAEDGKVRVYYDPAQPSCSVLEPGIDALALVFAFALTAFCYLASQFARGAAKGAD